MSDPQIEKDNPASPNNGPNNGAAAQDPLKLTKQTFPLSSPELQSIRREYRGYLAMTALLALAGAWGLLTFQRRYERLQTELSDQRAILKSFRDRSFGTLDNPVLTVKEVERFSSGFSLASTLQRRNDYYAMLKAGRLEDLEEMLLYEVENYKAAKPSLDDENPSEETIDRLADLADRILEINQAFTVPKQMLADYIAAHDKGKCLVDFLVEEREVPSPAINKIDPAQKFSVGESEARAQELLKSIFGEPLPKFFQVEIDPELEKSNYNGLCFSDQGIAKIRPIESRSERIVVGVHEALHAVFRHGEQAQLEQGVAWTVNASLLDQVGAYLSLYLVPSLDGEPTQIVTSLDCQSRVWSSVFEAANAADRSVVINSIEEANDAILLADWLVNKAGDNAGIAANSLLTSRTAADELPQARKFYHDLFAAHTQHESDIAVRVKAAHEQCQTMLKDLIPFVRAR